MKIFALCLLVSRVNESEYCIFTSPYYAIQLTCAEVLSSVYIKDKAPNVRSVLDLPPLAAELSGAINDGAVAALAHPD